MKINILPFIWRQLRGPQITAVATAVHEWIKLHFESLMDYYNSLSIQTAKESHLAFMGLLGGLARSIVSIPSEKMFWFTDRTSYHNNEHGVSDLWGDRTYGGKFTDLEEDRVASLNTRLPTEEYRTLLLGYINSEGQEGSLRLLDDISLALWKTYQLRDPIYQFEILTENQKNRSAGDIVVKLGSLQMWLDGSLVVRAVYETIENALYKPDPRLFPDMSEDGVPLTTESGRRITDENGLNIHSEVSQQ